jgi:hypothetical protein
MRTVLSLVFGIAVCAGILAFSFWMEKITGIPELGGGLSAVITLLLLFGRLAYGVYDEMDENDEREN